MPFEPLPSPPRPDFANSVPRFAANWMTVAKWTLNLDPASEDSRSQALDPLFMRMLCFRSVTTGPIPCCTPVGPFWQHLGETARL